MIQRDRKQIGVTDSGTYRVNCGNQYLQEIIYITVIKKRTKVHHYFWRTRLKNKKSLRILSGAAEWEWGKPQRQTEDLHAVSCQLLNKGWRLHLAFSPKHAKHIKPAFPRQLSQLSQTAGVLKPGSPGPHAPCLPRPAYRGSRGECGQSKLPAFVVLYRLQQTQLDKPQDAIIINNLYNC